MILNKFLCLLAESRLVLFLELTISFVVFRKHLARFATPLTAQDKSKLAENERNTGRCTAQSSGKGVNC